MPARILLIRHGQTSWNATGRWQGQGGPGLDETGHAQARLVPGLAALHANAPYTIVRSDLLRVAETAAYTEIHLGVEPHIDRRWRELDVGSWTGLTHEEVSRCDPCGYADWQAGRDVALGTGESYRELRERVAPAIRELAASTAAGTVLVFAHGGPVRAAVSELLGLPVNGERALGGPANCGVTVFERASDLWRLRAYNETSHLAHLGPGVAPVSRPSGGARPPAVVSRPAHLRRF